MNNNKKIFGRSMNWYILLLIPVAVCFAVFNDTKDIVPIVLGIIFIVTIKYGRVLLTGRVIEVDEEEIIIRGHISWLGLNRTFKMTDIQSAAIKGGLPIMRRNRFPALVLNFKNDHREEIPIRSMLPTDVVALEKELGKYVEIFTVNFKDI